MADTVLDEVLNVPFTFHRRPRALPCSMRPVWRLHLLVLVLDHCWAGKASLEQLHVLNWAIRSEETRQLFLQFIKGKRAPNQIIVRYDPSLSRAIDFAFAEKLVMRHEQQLSLLPDVDDEGKKSPPHRIVLSSKGKALVRTIMADEDAFVVERAFLNAIGRKVTQSQVDSLFTWSPMT
jgi:hypothetical protein